MKKVRKFFWYKRSVSILPKVMLVKIWFMQKIVGFNRRVEWPVHWSSRVIRPEKISFGSRFPGLSMWCHIDGRNGIVLGDNVWVGPRVSMISMNHDIENYNNYVEEESIVISKNCWIGTGATILPGVNLGEHTIVAAGAVVTKSYTEGNLVLAGVPAKPIKKLSNYKG